MNESPVQELYGRVLDNVGKMFGTLRSPITWLRAIFNFLFKR